MTTLTAPAPQASVVADNGEKRVSLFRLGSQFVERALRGLGRVGGELLGLGGSLIGWRGARLRRSRGAQLKNKTLLTQQWHPAPGGGAGGHSLKMKTLLTQQWHPAPGTRSEEKTLLTQQWHPQWRPGCKPVPQGRPSGKRWLQALLDGLDPQGVPVAVVAVEAVAAAGVEHEGEVVAGVL